MSVAVAVGRYLLAAVLAVAAWGKVTDRVGTRDAVHAFGVPGWAAAPVAFLLPVAELAVAVLLVVGPVVTGVVGALLLLTLFTVAVAATLARGESPDCHCFGGLRAERVTSRTLFRNVVLLAIAVLVAAAV